MTVLPVGGQEAKRDKRDKGDKGGKSKKPRCAVCRKKLSLIEASITCQCERLFCASHRFPELHGCEHNYKQSPDQKSALVADMKCVAVGFNKI